MPRERCQDCTHKFSCATTGKPPWDEEIRAVFAKRLSVESGVGRVEIRVARKRKGLSIPVILLPGARILGPGEVVTESRERVMARTNPSPLGRPREYERAGVARVYTPGGRGIPLPLAAPMCAADMTASLLRLDIGQRAPLDIGQQLTRTIERGPRAGSIGRIDFSPGGYVIDGIAFGSLSSALSWFAGFHRGPGWVNLARPHSSLYDAEGNQIQ